MMTSQRQKPNRARHRRTYGVDKLSTEGRSIVHEGLRSGATYDEIIALLQEATGEQLSTAALSRYRTRKWEFIQDAVRKAQAQAHVLANALKKNPSPDLVAATEQLLTAEFLNRIQTGDIDTATMGRLAVQVGALNTQRKKLELEKQRLELDNRTLELQVKRFEDMRQKTLKAVEKVNIKRIKDTAELKTQVLEIVREQLGL